MSEHRVSSPVMCGSIPALRFSIPPQPSTLLVKRTSTAARPSTIQRTTCTGFHDGKRLLSFIARGAQNLAGEMGQAPRGPEVTALPPAFVH